MLEKIEARLVPPPRECLSIITHEGEDDETAVMEKALAEHVARHPEDAGLTVKDFRWIVREIVQNPLLNPEPDEIPEAEISETEISAAEARNEITMVSHFRLVNASGWMPIWLNRCSASRWRSTFITFAET
jgi:hypothetical protein